MPNFTLVEELDTHCKLGYQIRGVNKIWAVKMYWAGNENNPKNTFWQVSQLLSKRNARRSLHKNVILNQSRECGDRRPNTAREFEATQCRQAISVK